jgi:peptidoglycan lytic transglycosylase G
MWRHIASNALTLFIVILVVVGGVIAWGKAQYGTTGPLDQAICVRVKSGATLSRLSDDLARRGAVSNASILRIGASYSNKADLLKAGSFLVPAKASMAEIVDIVTRGGASTCGVEVLYRIGVKSAEMQVRELDPASNRFVETLAFDPTTQDRPEGYVKVRGESDTRYRIALAEGATTWQIVQALRGADFLTGTVADLPPEGSLAPDSYEVSSGTNTADLLARMRTRQDERLSAAWQNRAPDLPVSTPQEALILASLIEKETGVASERAQVASVFVNRLRKGMRLQTDPSVIYGVTNGQGVLDRGLRQSELRRETPYNTYVIVGLPPTPIANPGIESIQAALHPAQTDYIFFVANGTGGHAFATTLAEHNKNVAAWKAIEASQGGN